MRILYVTAHYPPDFTSGATLQVQRLAAQALRAGHEVVVLSGAIRAGLADGEVRDDVHDGVRVRWIGTATRIDQDVEANWRNPLATRLMADLLDEWRPDVVHAHALQTLGADLLTEAERRGVPTFVTMHDMWWWCPRLFLVDRDLHPCPVATLSSSCPCATTAQDRLRRTTALSAVLDRVTQVLVPSRALRDVVIANGIDPARVVVDENDVDPLVVRGPAGDRPVAEGGDTRFVYVGGDHPMKGRDVLLEAVALVRRRRRWDLTMYGVERRRGRPGRWRHVRFVPPYHPSQTADVLGRADVLVIPSIARESYSLAAREALGAGLAVITSDCLGPEEVVEHGRNGLVVGTGDPVALAAAMCRLIDEPATLRAMQRSARSRPPHLRDPVEHVAHLVECYRRRTAPSSGP
jgi:glycosyltransferase involved in cell wall biosynthesis